jgi:hypothetical protein
LLVENQNRYHYHALPVLSILAGAAAAAMYDRMHAAVMARIEAKRLEKEAKEAREAHVRKLQEEEAERVHLRAQALHAQFDMGKAIAEGHIRIVASKAVEDAYAPKPQPAPDKPDSISSEPPDSFDAHEAENITVHELEQMASQNEPSDSSAAVITNVGTSDSDQPEIYVIEDKGKRDAV